MKFRSTRNQTLPVSLSEAITQGLAPDGGLYVPEAWPTPVKPQSKNLPEFAFEFLTPFFKGDVLEEKLEEICKKTFNFPLPIENGVLELFHGPTLAFKDFGARFLALCFENLPLNTKRKPMVLVATSGDTGGAVAAAFQQYTKIPVTILYPKDRISARQKQQLTCWGEQVRAFEVRGDFDDCQKMVKAAFQSEKWQKNYSLISANSINIARLLPQMVYFAFAAYQSEKPVSFIVPSGNTGNATAALWAKKLGAPIEKIIFAHNANSAVKNYFQTGQWHPQPTVSTLANAMDVGNPSNFERIKDLYPALEELRKHAAAFSVTDEQIRKIIQGEITAVCPHTATAVYTRSQLPAGNWIVVATAHPAKFETIVEPLRNEKIAVPPELKELLSKPSVFNEVAAALSELENVILIG